MVARDEAVVLVGLAWPEYVETSCNWLFDPGITSGQPTTFNIGFLMVSFPPPNPPSTLEFESQNTARESYSTCKSAGRLMATSISASIQLCLQSYRGLIAQIRRFTSEHGAEQFGIPWEDELGRLQVWTANIGAHQTNQSSLDHRLQYASHIRQRILELLEELSQTLDEVKMLIAEDDFLDSTSDDSGKLDPVEELSGLHEELVSIIDCLCQMSILVRRPARHDILTDLELKDVASYGPFDIAHVQAKFPKADQRLVNNLGAAITRRRKYLNYYKRHHAKLSQGLKRLEEDGAKEDVSELSETVATELHISAYQEGSFAGADASDTSYDQSLTAGEGMTIPAPPPESSNGSPFECPYCFHFITIDNSRAWLKHVLQDLQPYSCVVSDCPSQHRLYGSRREWYNHLRTAHKLYKSELDAFDESSAQVGSKLADRLEVVICPLCTDRILPSARFERHVARHLQELALFALPRETGDEQNEPHNLSLSDTESEAYDGTSQGTTGEADSAQLIRDLPHRWSMLGNSLKIVIQLPYNDREMTVEAKLVTGSYDFLSKRCADSLGEKFDSYNGPGAEPTGKNKAGIMPLGQLTLDWHFTGKNRTYTTTFFVTDLPEDLDCVLGDDTLGFFSGVARGHCD